MFNLKVYSKDLTSKETISSKKLEWIWNIQAESDGWFWNVNLTLDLQITNTDFIIWDIIKVYFKNDLIFTGSVLDINKLYWTSVENLTLVLVWYSSLLTNFLKTETYSDIASNIIKDIVDDFNIEYWTAILNYDASSIPDTTGTLDFVFTNKNYLDCLREVAETSWLKFFIDNDWKVYFREQSSYINHKLTLKKDVQELKIIEEWRNIKNSLILKYTGWTKTYDDVTSQTTYWKKEIYIDKSSELANLTTADAFGASYLLENSEYKKKITIEVNKEYDYFSIKPWDTITLRNTNYSINNLQIVKIAYSYEKATIELERSYSFANEIFNN